MIRNNSKRYSRYLLLLLSIFCLRVLAQLLQAVYPLAILPPFVTWHSGAIPYPVLLVSQIVIIIILAGIVRRFNNGSVMLNYQWGKMMLLLGGLYFIVMLFRLIVGLTVASGHDWFTATIPIIFHLFLACFLLTYGYYHYKYGGNHK